MKTQATRLTRREQSYWDFWTAQGYRFEPGEKPPLTTLVAPRRMRPRQTGEILLGLAIIVGALSLGGYWFARAAKLI